MPVPTTYEIVIRGRIGRRLLRPLLDEFAVEPGEGETRLVGVVQDPAHLHGIIAHLTSVAAEVVRIAARPPPDGAPRASPHVSSRPDR